MSDTTIQAIETEYAGVRFRSRLEARWARFFDVQGIEWVYEPEGYELPTGRYLPDFLLPECGTFIEVRGDPARVNLGHLQAVAQALPCPEPREESGPALMLLGHMPRPLENGDYGWLSFHPGDPDYRQVLYCGFGMFRKNRRPWWLDVADINSIADPLKPYVDEYEYGAFEAYSAAWSHRFWNPG